MFRGTIEQSKRQSRCCAICQGASGRFAIAARSDAAKVVTSQRSINLGSRRRVACVPCVRLVVQFDQFHHRKRRIPREQFVSERSRRSWKRSSVQLPTHIPGRTCVPNCLLHLLLIQKRMISPSNGQGVIIQISLLTFLVMNHHFLTFTSSKRCKANKQLVNTGGQVPWCSGAVEIVLWCGCLVTGSPSVLETCQHAKQ